MGLLRHSVRVLAVATLVVSVRPVAAGQAQLAQPDVAAFPHIQLYFYATDGSGQPILGARPGDFAVSEEGRAVPLASVRDASRGTPVEVCLTIDRSGSMLEQGKQERAQQAAIQFIQSLRPQDRAALISFADRPSLDRSLTRDLDGLVGAVRRLGAYGGTAVYDAIYWSVNQVALAPSARGTVVTRPARSDARRVVLALTDGDDNNSQMSPARVIEFARANGVTVYTIGLGSDARAASLDRLARSTGGRYFAAPTPQQLSQLYADIARQLQSEYTLSYVTPKDQRDGTRREVVVTLRAREGILRASGWYQAPGAGSSVIAVTRPTTDQVPPAPSITEAPGASVGPGFVLGLGLLAVTVAAIGVTLYGLSRRRRVASSLLDSPVGQGDRTIVTANPRIDLCPLWVRPPVTAVGRAEENDLVLQSPLVSRRHARIECADGEFRLLDMGSANGTYVNGERVTDAPLTVGDVVRFADQEFRFAGEQVA
jgi:VWFA-related protein